jgi:membrane associated rhomboid family serine protease
VPALAGREPWRFVTAAFLHSPSGFTHILFNMLALWMTGPYLEALLGRLRFAALYLLCAVGGSVGSLLLASPTPGGWWNPGWYTLSVGASGAVFGLFGALLVVQRRLRQGFGQIAGVIAVNGVIGFVVPGIAWQAHLGGLVSGLLLGLVLAHAPRERRSVVQLAGTAGVTALLVLAAAARLALAG